MVGRLRTYMAVVSAIGFAVLCLLAANVDLGRVRDELPRVADDHVDLEQTVRDALVLDLPLAPLCRPDCPGLCAECGEKWADLAPDHGHETLDPRWAALRERLPAE